VYRVSNFIANQPGPDYMPVLTETHEPELARPKSKDSVREVRYESTNNFAPILAHLGVSVVVSTYQAGKLVVLGTQAGALSLDFHNFKRAMGVAIAPDRMAVGTSDQVWLLRSSPQIAPHLESDTRHDACFLTRASWFTGEIQGHEMAWIGDELWVVNTRFSCLCTLDFEHSFVPRWQPAFVSALAAEDRCHLNGLAIDQGMPRYVTALGETNTAAGWRPGKASGGCLIDFATKEVVVRGLAMPHSPRIHDKRVWLLNSGHGQLIEIDPQRGTWNVVAELPGYTRGLMIHGGLAFIGLSRIRERSTFGGLPLESRRDELQCGVAVVDIATGRVVAKMRFLSGVEEVFDVQIIPARLPAIFGPYAQEEGQNPVWLLPHRTSVPSLNLKSQ
jgi:uncharacterized protein (TIGR03032 family)